MYNILSYGSAVYLTILLCYTSNTGSCFQLLVILNNMWWMCFSGILGFLSLILWNEFQTVKILYAFHWSVTSTSMDAFLLLTGQLNIVQFPVTRRFFLPWDKQVFSLLKMVFSPITSHSIVHMLSVSMFPYIIPWCVRKKLSKEGEKWSSSLYFILRMYYFYK